jgi:hypothetical protein
MSSSRVPKEAEPPIIAYLRERLARSSNDESSRSPIATVVGRGVVKALGVRGKKVAENPDGTNVYLYTVSDVRRILDKFDARVLSDV